MTTTTASSRDSKADGILLRKVIFRGLMLFFIANMLVALVDGCNGHLSLYNNVFPGRERFPYGENPQRSYNVTTTNLESMFASHVIADGAKPDNEYRVILLGDSAVWGWRLTPEETISGRLNSDEKFTCGEKTIRTYNLGYPGISLMKDILILYRAMEYDPDLIVWFVTLEGFLPDRNESHVLVQRYQIEIRRILDEFDQKKLFIDTEIAKSSIIHKTIIGARSDIYDQLRLQVYGVLWAATGIDQDIPLDYERAQIDFQADVSFHDYQSPLMGTDIQMNLLHVGNELAGSVPIIVINQPMLISSGVNSDLRYNYYYPRWAFDQYREFMPELSKESDWIYLDLWDLIPSDEFSNTPFHLTAQGELLLASQVKDTIASICP